MGNSAGFLCCSRSLGHLQPAGLRGRALPGRAVTQAPGRRWERARGCQRATSTAAADRQHQTWTRWHRTRGTGTWTARLATSVCKHNTGIRWAGCKLGPGSEERGKSLKVTNAGTEGSPATPSFVLAPEPRDRDAPAPGLLKHDGKKAICQVKLNNECFQSHSPSSETQPQPS